MLALSLVCRQQSLRSLQSARAILVPATNLAAARGSAFNASSLVDSKSIVPVSSSTLVPKSHFSVSSAKAASGNADFTKMWTLERILAVSLIPGVVVPFIYTTPLTDAIFCTLLVTHAHFGIEAIAVDYVRPVLFGGSTLIPRLCQGAVWVASGLALGGLYYFAYTDVGIVQAIKMLWKL